MLLRILMDSILPYRSMSEIISSMNIKSLIIKMKYRQTFQASRRLPYNKVQTPFSKRSATLYAYYSRAIADIDQTSIEFIWMDLLCGTSFRVRFVPILGNAPYSVIQYFKVLGQIVTIHMNETLRSRKLNYSYNIS